jgi:hypothetical protein
VSKCHYCGEEEELPFECDYCGHSFCGDHRLPPSHNCLGIAEWKARPPPSKLEQSYTKRETEPEPFVYEKVSQPHVETTTERKTIRKVALSIFIISFIALAAVIYIAF